MGKAYLCHDLDRRTWHNGAPGANTTRVSVCWIGNTEPTEEQITGMALCVYWVESQLGRAMPIRGHQDAPYPTQCPGPTWPQWRSRLQAVIDAL